MAHLPTPIVDGYLADLDQQTSRAIATIDASELDQEKARVAPRIAERLTVPTRSVERRLRAWERLSARLAAIEAGDDDYYLIDEYVNDLDIRDGLERLRAVLPTSFGALLDRLDERFCDATVDDGGAALRWRVKDSATATAMRGKWWRRRPKKLPWAE